MKDQEIIALFFERSEQAITALISKYGAAIRNVATNILKDAQDTEESGLFDEVIRYEDYNATVADMVLRYQPKRIALDFSENNAFCDGLTMGKYKKFLNSLNGYELEVVSADLFIPAVQEMNKR